MELDITMDTKRSESLLLSAFYDKNVTGHRRAARELKETQCSANKQKKEIGGVKLQACVWHMMLEKIASISSGEKGPCNTTPA